MCAVAATLISTPSMGDTAVKWSAHPQLVRSAIHSVCGCQAPYENKLTPTDDPGNNLPQLFNLYSYKTKSGKYIVISTGKTISDEKRVLDANDPNGDFKIFQKRVEGLEYSINHLDDKWYIRTNSNNATNFKLMLCEFKSAKMWALKLKKNRPNIWPNFL